MRIPRALHRIIYGAKEVAEGIANRNRQMLLNRASYKENLAGEYERVGMDEGARCLREEADKLRLEAEYRLISGDGEDD